MRHELAWLLGPALIILGAIIIFLIRGCVPPAPTALTTADIIEAGIVKFHHLLCVKAVDGACDPDPIAWQRL